MMSNGHDKPGEYRVLPVPSTADEIKTLSEQQEQDGFLMSGMNDSFIAYYKRSKKGKP
jgi:hypothetical protein